MSHRLSHYSLVQDSDQMFKTQLPMLLMLISGVLFMPGEAVRSQCPPPPFFSPHRLLSVGFAHTSVGPSHRYHDFYIRWIHTHLVDLFTFTAVAGYLIHKTGMHTWVVISMQAAAAVVLAATTKIMYERNKHFAKKS
jgi:hypothetical protein